MFDISLCRNLSSRPESGTLPEGHARLKGEKSRSVSQLVAGAGKWRQRSDVAPRVIVPGDIVMDLVRGDSIFLLPRPRATTKRSRLLSFHYYVYTASNHLAFLFAFMLLPQKILER